MNQFGALTPEEIQHLLELFPNQSNTTSLEQLVQDALPQSEVNLKAAGLEVSLQVVDLFPQQSSQLIVEAASQLVRLQSRDTQDELLILVPQELAMPFSIEHFIEIFVEPFSNGKSFQVVSSDVVPPQTVEWQLVASHQEWIEVHIDLAQQATYSTLRMLWPLAYCQQAETPQEGAILTMNEQPPQSSENPQPTVQRAQFSNFEQTTPTGEHKTNLDMLLDIPLHVTVELGRTRKTVKEILEITQGSIIELDKLAGEPVDILVNQKLIAVGEVVVIDEQFGIRVTDISSQADRLAKLR